MKVHPGAVLRNVVFLAALASPAGVNAQTEPETGSPAETPASPPDAAVGQARDAFVLGTALAGQGQWPEALAAFERSSALRPHPVTTYNLAYSERALGRYTRSYKLFRQSLAEHEAADKGTLPEDLLALLRGYLPEVERRLGRALVRVSDPEALLSIDGRPVESLPAAGGHPVFLAGTRSERGGEQVPGALFEVLVDPGEHRFVLSRPGTGETSALHAFAQGASLEVLLEAKVADPAPSAPPPASVRTELPGPDRTWVYVAYGVGAAGLVAGSVFGILAVNTKSYLEDRPGCPSNCPKGDQDEIDSMNRNADIATIGFGVGIAGAAVGTILLLTAGPGEPEASKDSASITPWVGLGTVGASARF